jgi:hypothetical protein
MCELYVEFYYSTSWLGLTLTLSKGFSVLIIRRYADPTPEHSRSRASIPSSS